MTETTDIPLFPLNTVLFPHQLLPLHVFEERYKLMIGECLRENIAFGVVLIKAGREVGGPAVPMVVGTTARIANVQMLEQGRMNLRTIGERPFRLLRVTQQRPYMRGDVEFLRYEPGRPEGLAPLLTSVKEQFSSHLDIIGKLSDRGRVNLNLDLDPEPLSYLIASVLAIQNPEKQALLEIAAAEERLRIELRILARENRALQTFLYLHNQSQSQQPGSGELGKRISPN